MTGLPVKLARDCGAAIHQLLADRIAVTRPIVGALIIIVPDRSAYSSRYVSPEALDKSERTLLDRACDANAARLRNKKKEKWQNIGQRQLLEPGVTVA
jgi:hypothetical protein